MTKTIKNAKASKASKPPKAETDLSSFTGRTADGTWNELDYKSDIVLSDATFASLCVVGSGDFKVASDADKGLADQRKPFQKTMKTIQHNFAVSLLKRHPIANGDWLTIPTGQTRWTLNSKFKAVSADVGAIVAGFVAAGLSESNVKKVKQRILDKARALAFERDFSVEMHNVILASFNKLATLSTEVTGTMSEKVWDKAEQIWETGADLIPASTRAALYAETLKRMEDKADAKAEREADKRAKEIARAAKANSNKTPKVNGALVG